MRDIVSVGRKEGKTVLPLHGLTLNMYIAFEATKRVRLWYNCSHRQIALSAAQLATLCSAYGGVLALFVCSASYGRVPDFFNSIEVMQGGDLGTFP